MNKITTLLVAAIAAGVIGMPVTGARAASPDSPVSLLAKVDALNNQVEQANGKLDAANRKLAQDQKLEASLNLQIAALARQRDRLVAERPRLRPGRRHGSQGRRRDGHPRERLRARRLRRIRQGRRLLDRIGDELHRLEPGLEPDHLPGPSPAGGIYLLGPFCGVDCGGLNSARMEPRIRPRVNSPLEGEDIGTTHWED